MDLQIGVRKNSCWMCDKAYVEETLTFNERMTKHIYSLSAEDLKSLYRHVQINKEYRINLKDAELIIKIKEINRIFMKNKRIKNIKNFNTTENPNLDNFLTGKLKRKGIKLYIL